jgi:type IV pilus assembly protein PilF
MNARALTTLACGSLRAPKRLLTALALAALALACSGPGEQAELKADTHFRLANSRLQRGAVELAIREYRSALAIAPDNAEYNFGIAEASRRTGEIAEAEKHLLRAIETDPDHQDARLNLSVVYLQQERWEDAIAMTNALLKDVTFLNPSRALVNRGWARYKAGDLKGAKDDLSEALVDGAGYQARLNLAIVLLDSGDALEAMTHLKRVISTLEKRQTLNARCAETEARFHMAKAHVKLGQREPAIGELRLGSERGEKCNWGTKAKEYLALLQ